MTQTGTNRQEHSPSTPVTQTTAHTQHTDECGRTGDRPQRRNTVIERNMGPVSGQDRVRGAERC